MNGEDQSALIDCCANSECREHPSFGKEVEDLLDLDLHELEKISFFESWRQRLDQEEVLVRQEQRRLLRPDLLSYLPTSVPFVDHSHL